MININSTMISETLYNEIMETIDEHYTSDCGDYDTFTEEYLKEYIATINE